MRVPHFKSRRDLSVAPAGFFTVLKTASRTVALRPPGGYRVAASPASGPGTSIETETRQAQP